MRPPIRRWTTSCRKTGLFNKLKSAFRTCRGRNHELPHSSRRVHAGIGETLEAFLAAGSLAIGVDRMQRNFEPMRRQTEQWRDQQLSVAVAKLIIYRAFIEGELNAPKHLAGVVHDLYFNPKYEEFQPRTMWSLSNAFTSAFKELDPIPQFKATAKLGKFLPTTAALAV